MRTNTGKKAANTGKKAAKKAAKLIFSVGMSVILLCAMMPMSASEGLAAASSETAQAESQSEASDSTQSGSKATTSGDSQAESQVQESESAESDTDAGADSEESDLDTSPGKEYTYTHINPHYSDVITEDDLEKPEEDTSDDSASGKITTSASKTVYSSLASAAKVVRSKMKSRKKTITLYYKRSKTTKNTYWQIFGKALDHTGNSTEGDYLYYHYGGYRVNYKYSKTYCKIAYTMTYYTSAKQETALTNKLKTVYSSLGLSKMTDDYDKISAIYQYVTKHTTYDYAAYYGKKGSSYVLHYSAYAAMVKGTAVCQGYANLIYRMLLDNGIDARIISSATHAWNIVNIGNTYYNVDSTWDAGYDPTKYKYFLKCNANFTESDHKRESEYTTSSFNKAYPMSTTDYASHSHIYTKAPTFKWKKNSYGGYSSCKAVFTCTGCKTTSSSKCSVSTSLSGGKLKYVAKVTRAGKTWTSSARYSTLKYSKGKSGLTVTGASTKKITSVNVPATVWISGTKYKVVAVKKNAFKRYTKIKSVTLGSNVKTIGNNAFYKCTALKSVNAKSTALVTIGKNAFSGDKKMTKAVFSSKKLKKIGKRAFYNCKKLSSVTFKTKKLSSKRVGSKAFKGIKSKCKFKVPSSKRTAYKKLFRKKGAPKNIRVVK